VVRRVLTPIPLGRTKTGGGPIGNQTYRTVAGLLFVVLLLMVLAWQRVRRK
jgi:hypothetical protein